MNLKRTYYRTEKIHQERTTPLSASEINRIGITEVCIQ